jgi:hypothetical protein
MELPPAEVKVNVSLKAVNSDDLAIEIFRILKINDPKGAAWKSLPLTH